MATSDFELLPFIGAAYLEMNPGWTENFNQISGAANAIGFKQDFMEKYGEQPIARNKRKMFDLFASHLDQDGKSWFEQHVPPPVKQQKHFRDLVQLFESEFCHVPIEEIILALRDTSTFFYCHRSDIRRNTDSVRLLVDRITQLEELPTVVEQLKQHISKLENQLHKLQASKDDTAKSLKDRQKFLQGELDKMAPTISTLSTHLNKSGHTTQLQKLEEMLQETQANVESSNSDMRQMSEQLQALSTEVSKLESMDASQKPLGEPIPKKCALCGKDNHKNEECGVRFMKCRLCLSKGHLARNCPKFSSESQCRNCGLANHTSEECGAHYTKCHLCHSYGHLARMCDRQIRYRKGHCGRCGGRDHRSFQCSAKRATCDSCLQLGHEGDMRRAVRPHIFDFGPDVHGRRINYPLWMREVINYNRNLDYN